MPNNNTTREIISELMGNVDSRVCEVVTEQPTIDVPVDPRIDIETIIADDSNPKFVNVEVLRSGISKTNNRRYNNNNVAEVNRMIPGVQGFFGHPDPSKYGFEFREPQCIYVGSIIDHMPDGLDRCIAKAYLFKTSPLREWIPKSIAAGNPMTVSINGIGDIVRNGDIIDVIHMTELQSIDWANPGTEGMETSQAMSVVREMQNENKEGGSKMAEVNAQDIIKNVTVTEFKAYNPEGYNNVLKSVTVQELQAVNPALVQSIIDANKTTEVSLNIEGAAKTVQISEMQGIVSGYEKTIADLKDKAETAKISEYKSRQIAALVPEQYREGISKRVTGKTEADIDASINAEIGYIREMGGMTNVPVGTQKRDMGSQPDIKEQVRDLFGAKKGE